MPVVRVWPKFDEEASRFFDGHLLRPRSLLKEFTADGKGSGSGRPAGPRDLLWQSVVVSGVAALEAGLEDLLFGAHAARLDCEGEPIEVGKNTPQASPRAWLVESRLQAPSTQKVERILHADFGIMLDTMPDSARFTVLKKGQSHAGTWQPVPGPADWARLSKFLDSLAYIRNATAHADARKLADGHPPYCEGELWLRKADGTWSVQQPHGLTALRAVLAIYNTVADALCCHLQSTDALSLTSPDAIEFH